MPGEIANNALFGGTNKVHYRQTEGFQWLLTFVPKMANVERFGCNKVVYSLSCHLFHISLAEWIQLTGKHMADEDWAPGK